LEVCIKHSFKSDYVKKTSGKMHTYSVYTSYYAVFQFDVRTTKHKSSFISVCKLGPISNVNEIGRHP